MKKEMIGILVVFLLAGCGNTTEDENDTNIIFKEEFASVSEIGDATGRILSNELTIDEVKEVFNGIFDLAIFESHSEEYGEITQGAGSDGKGGRIFCCKLPVTVKFTGSEASVHKFVEYFEKINNAVSFGEFNIAELEDDKYEVTTTVNFLGRASGGTLAGGKKEYTIKRNEVEVEEEKGVSLRDFDVSMIIRPSNSDSSAISFGVTEDKDYRVYSDENEVKDVTAVFTAEGNNYYCEYCIGNDDMTKARIKPSGNILFDILSCDLVEKDDEIKVNLHVINRTNKKVSVFTYDDKDERVNVVEKTGNVEVKKQ